MPFVPPRVLILDENPQREKDLNHLLVQPHVVQAHPDWTPLQLERESEMGGYESKLEALRTRVYGFPEGEVQTAAIKAWGNAADKVQEMFDRVRSKTWGNWEGDLLDVRQMLETLADAITRLEVETAEAAQG